MARSRTGWVDRPVDRTGLRLGLLVGAVSLAGLVGPAYLGLTVGFPHGSPVDTPVGLGPSGESPTCAQITTNATLNATYVGIYNGVKNWSEIPPGQNQSRPVNQSGYPDIATGEAELASAWTSICGSPTYAALLAANGLSGLISSSQLNASTGYFQLEYGFAYHASCSNPSDESSRACAYFTLWYVELPYGNVSGPVTTAQGNPLGNPPAPGPTAGGSGPPLSQGSSGTAGVAWLGGVVVAAGLGTLVIVLALRRSRPPSGPSDTVPRSRPFAVPSPHGNAPATSSESADTARTTAPSRASGVAEPSRDDDPLADIY